MSQYPAVPSMIANDQMPICLPGQKLKRVPNTFMLFKKAWGLVNDGAGDGRVVAARAGEMWRNLPNPERTKWDAYYDALDAQRKEVYPWYKFVRAAAGSKKPKRAYSLKLKTARSTTNPKTLKQAKKPREPRAAQVELNEPQQKYLSIQPALAQPRLDELQQMPQGPTIVTNGVFPPNDHDYYLAQQYLHEPVLSDFDYDASADQWMQQQQHQLGRQEYFLPVPAMPDSPQFQHASTSAYDLMDGPATYDIHYDTFADQSYKQQLDPQEQFLPMPVPASQQFQHASTSSQEQYLMYDRSATYNNHSDAFADQQFGCQDISTVSASQQLQYDASTSSQAEYQDTVDPTLLI